MKKEEYSSVSLNLIDMYLFFFYRLLVNNSLIHSLNLWYLRFKIPQNVHLFCTKSPIGVCYWSNQSRRSFFLGDNKLTGTSLWLDEGPEDDTENHTTHKSKLLFPNLGALDLSNNKIREIPSAINEMSNLSVLNISGNSGSYFFSCHLFFFCWTCLMNWSFLKSNVRWKFGWTFPSSMIELYSFYSLIINIDLNDWLID